MVQLYSPTAGLTLAGVRALVSAQFVGSFLRIATVSIWAAATGQMHLAPASLAPVMLCNVGMNILVFDTVGSLVLTAAVTAQHLLLLVGTTALWGGASSAGAPTVGVHGALLWENLVIIPVLSALLQAQAYLASWVHEQQTRRDHVLQTISKHRRNISQYLISNMLPAEVIAEIRRSKRTSIDVRRGDTQLLAWSFPTVLLLQSDIVGFTKLGSRISAEELCGMLHGEGERSEGLGLGFMVQSLGFGLLAFGHSRSRSLPPQ